MLLLWQNIWRRNNQCFEFGCAAARVTEFNANGHTPTRGRVFVLPHFSMRKQHEKKHHPTGEASKWLPLGMLETPLSLVKNAFILRPFLDIFLAFSQWGRILKLHSCANKLTSILFLPLFVSRFCVENDSWKLFHLINCVNFQISTCRMLISSNILLSEILVRFCLYLMKLFNALSIFRRWKVMLIASVYRQTLSTRSWSHYWYA